MLIPSQVNAVVIVVIRQALNLKGVERVWQQQALFFPARPTPDRPWPTAGADILHVQIRAASHVAHRQFREKRRLPLHVGILRSVPGA